MRSASGALQRFLVAGGRFGLRLCDVPDRTLAVFITCALRNAVQGRLRLLDLISEAQNRYLEDEFIARTLQEQGGTQVAP